MKKHILYLAMLYLCASCGLDDSRDVCRYTLLLDFRYHRQGKDEFTQHIRSARHFFFDETGRLYEVIDVSGNDCRTLSLEFPPGEYTLVSFANLSEASRTEPYTVGVTTIQEMLLRISEEEDNVGYHCHSERLFFAYRRLTAVADASDRHIIDMTHAHNILTISVRWNNGRPPVHEAYTMELTRVPGSYSFESIREVSQGEVVYIIPEPQSQDASHRTEARFRPSGSLEGSFTTYRYTNQMVPTFRLYGDGGEPLTPVIDLTRFFREMGWELTLNIEQVFDISILIDGNRAYVSPTTISDWEDGGTIKGGI